MKTPRLLKKSSKNRSSVGTVSFLILMILLFTSYYVLQVIFSDKVIELPTRWYSNQHCVSTKI